MASPGDLGDARAVIRTIEDLVNHAFESSGLRVRVVGWELTTPGYGRPQAQINPMVHDCDVFIGLLNRRWGSESGEFSSGFEEEFEIALKRRQGDDTPAIAMFFAELPAELTADPGPQLTRVLAFKNKIRTERIALYQEFRSSDHLAWLVLAFLTNHVLPLALGDPHALEVQAESGTDVGKSSDKSIAARTETERGQVDVAADSELEPAFQQLSDTFRSFDSLVCGRPFETLDTDRLVLIARAFERNPDPMGTHLANRVYRRRADLHLSAPEVDLWLRTLFADIGTSTTPQDRVIPGWPALFPEDFTDEAVDAHLVSFAGDQTTAVARGSLRVLTRLSRRPKKLWGNAEIFSDVEAQKEAADAATEGPHEHELALQTWVDMFNTLPGVDAAFDYLCWLIEPTDDGLLEAISTAKDLNEASKDAVVALQAAQRGDFGALATLAPSNFSKDTEALTSLLAARIDELPVETLERIASHSKPRLRRAAIKRLLEGDIDEQVLKEALAWADSETLAWLQEKAGASAAFGEAMLSIVTKEPSKYPYGTEAVLLSKLRSADELRAMSEASTLNDAAWQALTILLGKDMLKEARQMLDTDAHNIRTRLAAVAGDYPDVIPYVAAKYRAASCALIGDLQSRDIEDVKRLVTEVERQELTSRAIALLSLSRVANEELLPIVDASLTNLDDYIFVRDAAELMSGGLAGLIAERWRNSEIGVLKDSAVRWNLGQPDRSTEELTLALYDPHPPTRMAALELITKRLNRRELTALLESYPEGKGTHWYNVVAGLDESLFGPDSVLRGADALEARTL